MLIPDQDHQTDASRWECHLSVPTGGVTAADFLAAETPLSKQKLKQVMNKGAVWLSRAGHTQRLRRASKSLRNGDELHVYYDAHTLSRVVPEAILIADEGDYSVWYKPYGMLSQGSQWGDHCSLLRFSEKYFHPERLCFLVHRLDRAATGLMLIAHHKRGAVTLSKAFKERRVEKIYQAVVKGEFPDGEQHIETPLDDKPAITIVKRLDFNPVTAQSLLAVNIKTGRKHQIRRHLSSLGFPICGDRLYGKSDSDDNLQLCAVELAFTYQGSCRRYALPEALRLTHKF